MDPYLGEIRLFACTFVPKGWAPCNGALFNINQATALYSLLGNLYGGNGTTNFALPNLNGNTAVGMGQSAGTSNYPIGSVFGVNNVTLLLPQMAAHVHTMPAGAPGVAGTPPSASSYLSATPGQGHSGSTPLYASPATQSTSSTQMAPNEAGQAGGNQPHSNQSPSLALQYCIATLGIYPPRQ